MRLCAGLFLGLVLLILASCEKCMKCSYTYTVTTIEQTLNGEEEVVTTYTGYAKINDTTYIKDECIKNGESFTIESYYQAKADTTVLDNFQYTCEEL